MRLIKDPTLLAGMMFFVLLITALVAGPRLLSADPAAAVTPVVVIK